MKKAYLLLQLKNCKEILKNHLKVLILAIFFLTAAFAAVNFLVEKKAFLEPIKVAVIVQEDDSMTKLILRYISHEKSIESIASFEYTDRESAFSMLSGGEANAVIDFGEDFFDNVNNGINAPLLVIIREDADSMTRALAELLTHAQGYVRNAESVVYSFLELKGEAELKEPEITLGDTIALIYANMILRRNGIFHGTVLSPLGEVDLTTYLFGSVLMIFLLFLTTSFEDLYDGSKSSFSKVIRIYGVSDAWQSLMKQAVLAMILFAMSLLLYAGYILALRLCGISQTFSVSLLPALLLVSVSLASLYNMLMMILSNHPSSRLLPPVLYVLMMLCANFPIPAVFLPKAFEILGRLTPFSYLGRVLFGDLGIVNLSVILFFIILENAVGGFVCKKQS